MQTTGNMAAMSAPETPTPQPWHQLPGAPAGGTVVGALHSFSENAASMVTLPAAVGVAEESGGFKLLVLRTGPEVHAFANRCAHFGVPLAAKPAQLISTPLKSLTCNVHYARYRWADGACEAGECDGEALIAVPLVVRPDGIVCIGQPQGAGL